MKKICVAGDVAVDWFHLPLPSINEGVPFREHNAPRAYAKPGGAWLLAELLQELLETQEIPFELNAPRLPKEIRRIPNEEILYSHSVINNIVDAAGAKAEARYRIGQYLGYADPEQGAPGVFPYDGDQTTADMIVLDDGGTHFRNNADRWPSSFHAMDAATVIYKMKKPLCRGPIWEFVKDHPPRQLVSILNAKELRRTAGVHISKALSWERTAKDLVYQLQRSEVLEELQQCSFIIVLLGTDGAVLVNNGQHSRATLIFDPARVEGGFSGEITGTVKGLTTLFTAGIAASLAEHGFSTIQESVQISLARTRAFLEHGNIRNDQKLEYPGKKIYSADVSGSRYAGCPIPAPRDLQHPDPDYWRILDQKTRNTRLVTAEDMVRQGQSTALQQVPAVRFGKLISIDRREIEQLSAVRELLEEYLDNPKPTHPLCFAVFGPPGSGKSFTVKQIFKSVSDPDLVEIIFNLSQFRDYRDLVKAFHQVKMTGSSGRVPFVFFDEFDAAFGPLLGWLKYFLAPMHDGIFMDGENLHSIGKAIFVFAGGTKSSFRDFVNTSASSEQSPDNMTAEQQFRAAKGPDFVSRLRGFIDIMGPNRQATADDDDDAFVLRRAKLLRVLLELEPTATNLYDPQQKLSIDDSVLRALLHVSRYRHGARSISALLEMSRLAGKKHFDISALPAREQLNLHVDADEFMFLTVQERNHSLFRKADFYRDPDTTPFRENEEAIIKAVAGEIQKAYDTYWGLQNPEKREDVDSFPDFLLSNEEAAADLPHKLRTIDCGLRKYAGSAPNIPDITDREVETLARHEHRRWCRERKLQGWTLGEKNIESKTSPYLLPFEELPEAVRDWNLQMIYSLPVILKELGYEVYRMEESELIRDEKMVHQLGRALHADYVEQRKKEGETPEENPALVPWDQLPEDLKQANRGSAETIPRKLQLIGYEIQLVEIDEDPPLLSLSEEEIEQIAEWEHTRWSWEKRFQGWSYKEGEKNLEKKTSPHLVPWSRLSEEIKERDREPARMIPQLLQQAGFKARKQQKNTL